MIITSSTGPGWTHKLGTLLRSPTWVQGAQTVEPPSAAFLGPFSESWIRSGAVRKRTSNQKRWQNHSWSLLRHSADANSVVLLWAPPLYPYSKDLRRVSGAVVKTRRLQSFKSPTAEAFCSDWMNDCFIGTEAQEPRVRILVFLVERLLGLWCLVKSISERERETSLHWAWSQDLNLGTLIRDVSFLWTS